MVCSGPGVSESLAALSVALTWGATILAVLFAGAAIGYGVFLRNWIKQEARVGASDYLRSAEGQAALTKLTADHLAANVRSPLIVTRG